MRGPIFAASAAATLVLCTSPAIADHNSQNGPGWANMPNDIHNTRIETLEADDNEAFRDFVRYGEGADSVNSLNPPDEDTAGRAMEQKGKPTTEKSLASQRADDRKNQRVQEQRQMRPEDVRETAERQRTMRDRDTGYRAERPGADRQRARSDRGRR